MVVPGGCAAKKHGVVALMLIRVSLSEEQRMRGTVIPQNVLLTCRAVGKCTSIGSEEVYRVKGVYT